MSYIPSFSFLILPLSHVDIFTLLAQNTAIRQAFVSFTLHIVALILIFFNIFLAARSEIFILHFEAQIC